MSSMTLGVTYLSLLHIIKPHTATPLNEINTTPGSTPLHETFRNVSPPRVLSLLGARRDFNVSTRRLPGLSRHQARG